MTASREKKSRLARRGVELIDAASPDKIQEKVRETVSDAATSAVLDAVRSFSGEQDERRPGPLDEVIAERKLSGAIAAMDALGEESFDRRLAAAAAAGATADRRRETLRRTLGDLRTTFPEESREFAVLIFSCMELIEAWNAPPEGGAAPSAAELTRKEALLTKVAALLEPRAGEALQSFVTHIVTTSRKARERG